MLSLDYMLLVKLLVVYTVQTDLVVTQLLTS